MKVPSNRNFIALEETKGRDLRVRAVRDNIIDTNYYTTVWF